MDESREADGFVMNLLMHENYSPVHTVPVIRYPKRARDSGRECVGLLDHFDRF